MMRTTDENYCLELLPVVSNELMLETYEAFLSAYRILSAIEASESGAAVQVNGLKISATVSDALLSAEYVSHHVRKCCFRVTARKHCQYNAVIRQIKLKGGRQEFHGLIVDQLRGLVADCLPG
jgi:hypothetical protein